MKLPKSKVDIIDAVAKDTGYKREHVNFVIKNFEESLRFYIVNPAAAGRKILLSRFGCFTFNIEKAKKRAGLGKPDHPLTTYYKEFFKKFGDE